MSVKLLFIILWKTPQLILFQWIMDDHIQGILFKTKIFQLISDFKMFKGSLLAKLLDKGFVYVEKTWEMIFDSSVNESKFRSIIQSKKYKIDFVKCTSIKYLPWILELLT
jgi:hypothetical protein